MIGEKVTVAAFEIWTFRAISIGSVLFRNIKMWNIYIKKNYINAFTFNQQLRSVVNVNEKLTLLDQNVVHDHECITSVVTYIKININEHEMCYQ